jgi:mannose-6-phosphate isomerase-like protein (cupin superfamily)
LLKAGVLFDSINHKGGLPLIRASNEMTVELRENMRGGKGTITIKHLFKQEELTGKARLVAEVTIPAGGSIGFHNHDQEEEIFYIISGQGRVVDQGETRDVAPGDAILTGGGKGHAVENIGAEPLVMVAVILPYNS